MVFGLGGGGLKIYVAIDPSKSQKVIQLDHPQSWKVRKNPFHHAIKRNSMNNNNVIGINPMSNNSAVSPYPGVNPAMAMSTNTYAFEADQDVSGTITLSLPSGKRYDHLGIKAQFVGRISTLAMQQLENRSHYDFVSLSKELAPDRKSTR